MLRSLSLPLDGHTTVQRINEEKAEKTRASVTSITCRAQQPRPNLKKGEKQALASLRKNDITILQAGKGNKTVILDAKDYEKKAMEILHKPPFHRLARDPTSRNEKHVNDCPKNMKDMGEIDEAMMKKLRVLCNGMHTPVFYGTAKVHKPECPLRLIVSPVGSATYNIANFVISSLITVHPHFTFIHRKHQTFCRGNQGH